MAKVALLIGVSEYEEGLAPLPSAVKDIEELQRVLQHPEMGGFDEVKTLANPEAHTMQFQIETLFDGRAKDDLVLFFFSGHGIKDDAGKLYFASRYTRKNAKGELVRSTAVPTSFVHEIMNNSRAKRQAIILDCCFSGAFDPSLQSKDDGSVDLQTQLGAEGRVVLTSSSSTQYSFSPTEQQGSDLSIYTRYLVEGIETGAGDINSDGFISMLELHEYAAGKVRETAPKMTPKIIVLKDKGFEIVLSKARVTDPKLRYRKAASKYANAGAIRPAGRAVLNKLRQQLGITIENATEIENEVLRPYQERLANLQQYREALIASAEQEYPLNQLDREDLTTFQQMLGLGDEDVLPIQQEVEAQFVHQSNEYQQNSLGLKEEDIVQIEQPLFKQIELRHQQELKQADQLPQEEERAVEKQQDDAKLNQKKAELKQKLQQRQQERQQVYEQALSSYEENFKEAISVSYPIDMLTRRNLMHLKVKLGIKDEDAEQIQQVLISSRQGKDQRQFQQKEQQEAKAKRKKARAYFDEGVNLYSQGKLDEAITACCQAIQINPNYGSAYHYLGRSLQDQGKLDEAIDAYRQTVQINSKDWVSIYRSYIGMGHALHSQGKFDEAIYAYSQALQIQPDDVSIHLDLGITFHNQGKLDEAIFSYYQVIQIDSRYLTDDIKAKAYNYLGTALFSQRKIEEAITAYRKAIELNPNDADYQSNLEIALKEQNKGKKFLGLF